MYTAQKKLASQLNFIEKKSFQKWAFLNGPSVLCGDNTHLSISQKQAWQSIIFVFKIMKYI